MTDAEFDAAVMQMCELCSCSVRGRGLTLSRGVCLDVCSRYSPIIGEAVLWNFRLGKVENLTKLETHRETFRASN